MQKAKNIEAMLDASGKVYSSVAAKNELEMLLASNQELLAALKDCYATLMRMGEGATWGDHPSLINARAAIAKATASEGAV